MRITDTRGVAEYIGSNERHVRELRYKRLIPALKVGGSVRYDLDEIDAWLDAHREPAQAPA